MIESEVIVKYAEEIKFLKENCDVVPDFPKKGISFYDTMSLFRNPVAFTKIIDMFADYISQTGAEALVGLEARGIFIQLFIYF